MVSLLDRVRGRSVVSAPSEPEPEPEDLFKEMTLQEHLEELRQRLIYSILAIVVGFVVGLILAFPTLDLIRTMAGLANLPAISPTEPFITYTKVALYIGIGLAMPVIIYQLVRFLAPGLTRRERRYLYRALPVVTMMFVSGVAFAFFVVIPRGLQFLANFGNDVFEAQFRAEEVVSFYLTLMLWVGIVFELPVVIFILAKLGIVDAQRLSSLRKYALMVIMVAAAVITPTPDPFNMFFVAAPMYALYEAGVLLARLAKPIAR